MNSAPTRFRDEFIPLFRSLIRNACVNTGDADSGDEDRSVATLQKYFAQKGLSGTVLHARPGRGNLLIRIPGKVPGSPSLMFMGHLDVVPAEASDWSVDPFSAEEKDGQIWGRGAVDMLCWTAAQAVGFASAVEKAAQKGFPGDLVFLAVADEEASGRWGARFLTEKHWDLVQADYMITELGGFFYETSKGPIAFCTRGEKGVAWTKLTFRGTPGHGSMPFLTNNAVVKASLAVVQLAKARFPTVRSPLYSTLAQSVAQGWRERLAFSTGWGESWALGRLFKRNPGMARFLQTAGVPTLSCNTVHGGTKVNIVADRAEVMVDCRLLPGMEISGWHRCLRTILGKSLGAEVEIEQMDWFPSNVSPRNQPLFSAVEDLFHRVHPEARLVDLFIGGVTDGRYWRAKGTTVLGFSLFDRSFTIDDFGARIHGIDERIDLTSLELAVNFFSDLPERFFQKASAPTNPQ